MLVLEEDDLGRKEKSRPPWSYCAADEKGKEKEMRAERKEDKGAVWDPEGGGAVGAGGALVGGADGRGQESYH